MSILQNNVKNLWLKKEGADKLDKHQIKATTIGIVAVSTVTILAFAVAYIFFAIIDYFT